MGTFASPVLVLYDAYSEPILMLTGQMSDGGIWTSIENMISFKPNVLPVQEHTFDIKNLSNEFVIGVVPEAFFVDNVIRYQGWVQFNRKPGVDYFFIRERLHDGFGGNILKQIGHFKHLPNEARIRIVFVTMKPRFVIESLIL
jgi:hypothetical protein